MTWQLSRLRAISPPSTGITAPVRYDAAGRHRLTVICATSSPAGVETALATALERRVQVLLAGGDRERAMQKEKSRDYYKRRKQLHPEYAGIYADGFLGAQSDMRSFQELLVFKASSQGVGRVGLGRSLESVGGYGRGAPLPLPRLH